MLLIPILPLFPLLVKVTEGSKEVGASWAVRAQKLLQVYAQARQREQQRLRSDKLARQRKLQVGGLLLTSAAITFVVVAMTTAP